MDSIVIVTLLIYGLLLGSFYNVVGLRVPMKESIVKPRSHCPKCGHTLGPLELIPVLSYVIQGGKCRCCQAPVSPLYPLVELLAGVLFLLAPLVIGWSSELFVAWTLISLLIIITVSDFKYMLIPDRVLIVFAFILGVERVLIPLTPWWDPIVGAIVGFTLLLLIALVSKGGMGGGDIKLYAVIGLALGWKLTLLSFFFATLYGTLFGMVGLLLGKVKRGKPIPFGPFIALGTLTVYFYGERLLEWYVHLFM